MADASTLQVVLAAAVGGLASAVVSMLTRRVEFRREDRTRWISESRESYAAYIAAMTGSLADGAALHRYLTDTSFSKFRGPGDEERVAGYVVKTRELADSAHQHWLMSQRPRESLRLLASRDALAALDEMDQTLRGFGWMLTGLKADGVGDVAVFVQQREALQAQLIELIEVARRDIGADGLNGRPLGDWLKPLAHRLASLTRAGSGGEERRR